MEDFVTDQNHRGEKMQLKVAERVENANKNTVIWKDEDDFFLDLLKCCWGLGLISADYEQWEEDGEQGGTE